MTWEQILLVLITGFVTGIINTLAGSGSLISLPVLMFIGLSPHTANATNRIGILFQNIVSSWQFYKKGILDIKTGLKVSIPAILGSVIGAYIVLEMRERVVEITIGVILLIMLVPLFYKPKLWLHQSRKMSESAYGAIISFFVFFLVGIYGGFIQAGVGIFLLTTLVLIEGFDLLKANALKVFINLLFTPFALIVFYAGGEVDFLAGLVLAVGNATGAYIASKYAMEKGSGFVRYFLVFVIIAAGIKLLFFPS